MGQIALTSGFYKAKSIIAGAQRCLNLYPERNRQDAPFPYTCYHTPGATLLANNPISATSPGTWRGLYTATTGDLYGVLGNRLYWIDSSWNCHLLGLLASGSGQVSMSDNRLVVLVVDGTTTGYSIDLTAPGRAFAQVTFSQAASVVDYLDTFFVFLVPNTNQFFLSLSEITQAMLTSGPSLAGVLTNGGTGYTPGVHNNAALSGGSGSGATATITVSPLGAVTSVSNLNGGTLYKVGDVLSATGAALGGGVITGAVAAGGSGYPAGTYGGVPLTGGSGAGATATITVAGGVVTAVVISAAGLDYVVGDILSAQAVNLGGTGSGFQFVVNSITGGGSGFAFTISAIGTSAFDSLDIATKTGSADGINSLKVMHNELWLLGDQKSTEIWYDAGNPDFSLQRYPGVFLNHGCAATFSVAMWDDSIFWIAENQEGQRYILKGAYYRSQMISEPAMQNVIDGYATVSDAIGFIYEQDTHPFYVLVFPSADATWVYDIREQLWHERAWLDPVMAGEHRIRANCCAVAYGQVVVGDWQNGQLLKLDPNNGTDNGNPIPRRRGFPHLTEEGHRICVHTVIARVDVGTASNTQWSQGFDGGDPSTDISIRASTTAGARWHEPRIQSMGSAGQYNTSPKWNQFGMGRDWVFELYWDFPFPTAVQGLWITATPAHS